MNFLIGGYLLRASAVREQFQSIEDPVDHEIFSMLLKIKGNFGVVSMENRNDPDAATELTLYSQREVYLLLMQQNSSDGGVAVRTYHNSSARDEYVEILGEKHHASTVLADFGVVVRAFSEFRATGDVSWDLLS